MITNAAGTHRCRFVSQLCFQSPEEKIKRWPQEKPDCVLCVLLQLRGLEDVFGKTKSEIQVSAL